VKLTTELHLVARLRMSGGIPPVLPSFLYESVDTTLPFTWPQGKLEIEHLVGNMENFRFDPQTVKPIVSRYAD